ncbi:lipoprotein LpqV [Rhodococcoides corynebacterioides]|uniref:lipoprotein LpqV n=1 Tax=Rhodococcoides corynebacterioides TaxID=53972 RepID=UPI003F7D999B
MNRALLVLAAGAVALVAGCSSKAPDPEPTERTVESSTPAATTSAAPATTTPIERITPTEQPASSLYEVAPDGLTTAVNVPVDRSSPEFADACADAQQLVSMFGSDLTTLLALTQAAPEDSNENVTVEGDSDAWGEASPEDQALVLAGIQAAAAGEC